MCQNARLLALLLLCKNGYGFISEEEKKIKKKENAKSQNLYYLFILALK